MTKFADEKGMLRELQNDLYESYIGKSFYVVLRNECKITDNHSRKDAFKKIKMVLEHKELREALTMYKNTKSGLKNKAMLFLLKCRLSILIYLWLSRGLKQTAKRG